MWYKLAPHKALCKLVMIAGLVIVLMGTWSHEGLADRGKLLVVYEDASSVNEAATISMFIGHFNLDYDVRLLDEVSVGEMNQYSLVMFIDSTTRVDERSLSMARFHQLQTPLLWVGFGDFDQAMHAIRLEYEGQSYPTQSVQIANTTDKLPGDGPITWLATASDGIEERPLIMKQGNRWYYTATELRGHVGWILADVLHDVVGHLHHNHYTGLIRIEDVHPLIDPDRLKEVADVLSERQIPFAISVIPYLIDPETRRIVHANEYPEWIQALRYMAEAGGTFILDAYSLIEKDEKKPLREVLERDIAILSRHGLYPIAYGPMFENISENDLQIVGQYFTSLVGRVAVKPIDSDYDIDLPYEIDHPFGLHVYPMTIGYSSNSLADVAMLRDRVRQLATVRDAFIGIQHYPTIEAERLEQLLTELSQEPIAWIDLRTEAHQLTSRIIDLETDGEGSLRVEVKNARLLEELSELPKQESSLVGHITEFLGWFIVVIVLLFVLLFTIFTIYLRNRRRYRLFNDSEEEP